MTEAIEVKPQIAIVGTEGSGKTVLASTLAQRMSSVRAGCDVYLHPDGSTDKYIEEVWLTLNEGKWWRTTEPGQKFELQWTLNVGQLEFPVKLIDSAGQDLRGLFSQDTSKGGGLTRIQQELLDYIQTASVVIVVVNLLHFRGEADGVKRAGNQRVLKEVVDMFTEDGKRGKHRNIAIVFTAWDLYDADISRNYGDFSNYLERELPRLYNAMRLAQRAGNTVSRFPIAAVAETEKKWSDERKRYERVPKPGFRSDGLDELEDWLIRVVADKYNREFIKRHNKKYDEEMRILNMWLIPTVAGVLGVLPGLFFGSLIGAIFLAVLCAILALASMNLLGLLEQETEEDDNDEDSQEQRKTARSRESTEDVKKAKRRKSTNAVDENDNSDTTAFQSEPKKSKSVKF